MKYAFHVILVCVAFSCLSLSLGSESAWATEHDEVTFSRFQNDLAKGQNLDSWNLFLEKNESHLKASFMNLMFSPRIISSNRVVKIITNPLVVFSKQTHGSLYALFTDLLKTSFNTPQALASGARAIAKALSSHTQPETLFGIFSDAVLSLDPSYEVWTNEIAEVINAALHNQNTSVRDRAALLYGQLQEQRMPDILINQPHLPIGALTEEYVSEPENMHFYSALKSVLMNDGIAEADRVLTLRKLGMYKSGHPNTVTLLRLISEQAQNQTVRSTALQAVEERGTGLPPYQPSALKVYVSNACFYLLAVVRGIK